MKKIFFAKFEFKKTVIFWFILQKQNSIPKNNFFLHFQDFQNHQ
jgi:hypothetical protein